MSRRPNLIVMRAGDTSMHPAWLALEGEQRNWDLHISYFGDRPDPYGPLPDGVTLSVEKGPKAAGLQACFAGHPGLTQGYASVMVADDDMQIITGTFSQAFDIFAQSGALLGQVSLDRRSYFSHEVTLNRPACLYREVNFVEIMAPMFRGDFLTQFLDMFTISKTSWGLDIIMSARALKAGGKVICIDAVKMLHTRAVGALKGNYVGVDDPRRDRDRALAAEGITLYWQRTLAGIAPDGRRIGGWRLNFPPLDAYFYALLRKGLGVKVIQD